MPADTNGVIVVAGTDFPARLHRLRTERRLTKVRLAALAGLNPRSITDFENGRRDRVLASSIFLLAGALGVAPEDLLGRPLEIEAETARPDTQPAPPSGPPLPADVRPPLPGRLLRRLRSRWALGVIASLLLSIAGAVALHEQATASPRVSIEDGVLVGRDSILGRPLWRYDGAPANVVRWYETPWGSEKILFGVACDLGGEGAVLLAHRRTGQVIWKRGLDRGEVARAFPEEGARLEDHVRFGEGLFLDIDGDGQRELLVQFDDYWEPKSYLCLLKEDGTVLGQYCHHGKLVSRLIQDFDGDGKDEVLAAGQNMADCLRGASFLLLDDAGFRGASRDTLCGPWAGLPDSSRARLALPSFGEPYMGLLGRACLDAVQLRTFEDEGEIRICADVGCGLPYVIVTLDSNLRPLHAAVADAMIEASLRWPEHLRRTGPADPAWAAAWLARGTLFEFGRAVPLSGS